MAEHFNTTNLSRRQALGLPVAASAAIAAFGHTSSSLPDLPLLALGKEFEAAWAHELEAYNGADDSDSDDTPLARAIKATSELVDRIISEPATTHAGFRVKARAICWCRDVKEVAENEFDGRAPSTDMRLIAVLLRDVLAA